MRVYHNLQDFQANRPVVTIGTFDGVHSGHRKVLDRLKKIASGIRGETVVFTFHPHPRQVVSPGEKNLRLLNTLDEKVELLRSSGIDHLVVYPFTGDFARLTYQKFVHDILVEKIKPSCVVVGYDHKFGHKREGDYNYLRECSEKYNFMIENLGVLLINEVNVSSTRIREALESGDVLLANKYLGYPYELHGRVIQGNRLGREMGFPTANIEAAEITKLIPGYGVYAVKIKLADSVYNGMLNIGTRPTFNHNADNRSIEVNIFGFDGILYGDRISLVFYAKIRNEIKFSGKEALIVQLHKDKETAQKILSQY